MATNDHDVNSNNEEIPLTLEAVSTERGKLYIAALKGDWKSIESMPRIQRRIGIDGETTLHVAAAANQEKFVKKLLTWMENNLVTAENEAENVTVTAQNNFGTTALNFAAAVGNVKIAEAMLNEDKELPNKATRGDNPTKPLFMAAFAGHSEMVNLLYRRTSMDENEAAEIFITCVKNDLYVSNNL
ncbi:hypothetical protein CFP56_007647 [Quercus suber]|uniref:Ankyrin repeat-containing protein n=1 Tax=Quercus suber TaxID=58331 RepID=A0AAW0L594_QUESU